MIGRTALCLLAILGLQLSAIKSSMAGERSRIPPMATYQAMLDANQKTGWVAIAEQNGKQLLSFTPLLTLSCRLKEIRFSINSRKLDEQFPLMDCNPQLPFSVPSDVVIEELLIRLDAGSIENVAVQVVWEDGRESAVQVYEPCENADGRACAWPVD